MRVRVPLPYRPRERVYAGLDDETVRASCRAALVHDVPLSLLRATQHTVGADRVEAYELDPDMPSEHGSPLIVQRNGRLYVRNGHHRATAAIRRGDRTLRARVAHLDTGQSVPFRARGHAGELLLIDPRAMQATYPHREVEDVAEMVGDIAVICIDGPLESKPGYWGFFDDYESILCRFRSAIYSDDVSSVLLKIDSGGGSAAGLNECVDAMRKCKRETGKMVCAYVDEGAYSAAYALACVADEIYLPRSGGVGSIGVIVQLVSWAEANAKDGVRFEVITSGARKADFNPNVPISNAAIARVQARVDGLAKIYFQLVKDTRGVNAKSLEADTFYGKDAVRRGLADYVMSLDAVLAGMSELDKRGISRSPSMAHAPQGTERHTMSTLIALTAKVKAATEALAKSSRKTRDAAAAQLALAESALAKELSKVTKDKKTVTTIHESESESSSSESSSGSSSSESESESESESASYESESESASHEDERALAQKALEVTGKRTIREALGALEAMRDVAAAGPKAMRQLQKLTTERANRKVEDLISAGKASHKITPGNEAKARKIAAKHGHRALAAFIDAAMPAIDGREVFEAEDLGSGMHVTEEQRKIWTKMGYEEKDFPELAKKMQKEAERLTKGLLPLRTGGSNG